MDEVETKFECVFFDDRHMSSDQCVQFFMIKATYIDKTGTNEPILVVNRGHGNATYKLDWLFIDGTKEYLIENHLNMIKVPGNTFEEKKTMIEKIINSFKNPKTQEFISIFLGNNGLSKTELEEIFPIYL